jgi:hypothetical protein
MSADLFRSRPGDFDFLVGRWKVANRRLRERLSGCDDWEEFPADYQGWTHLGGALSLDEFRFPSLGTSACSIRILDVEREQWVIYWVTRATGVLDRPVCGGWSGDRGEFLGNDVHNDRPVEVRYLWRRGSPSTASWEQAFRPTGGDWETKWTKDLERIS